MGRPTSESAGGVRDRLIEVASQRFAENGYRGTTVRRIAREAAVTPAMVSYYFGDKAGLLEAVLDSVFGRLFEDIQRLATEASDRGLTIERFIDIYLSAITAQPWIPHFLVREVLSENTPVRERFVDAFARRAAEVVPALFERQIAGGRLRSDLDPRMAVLSLIGMCVFPLIAEPVLGPLLDYRLTPEFTRRLIRHTQTLYLRGAQAVS